MKLANFEVWNAVDALKQLAEKEFPVKTAYWIARLSNKLAGPYRAIDIVRQGLVKKNGKLSATNQFEVKPEDEGWDQFMNNYEELMGQEVEIDTDPIALPIKIPQEVHGEPISVKFNILAALEKFIEVEGI